MNTTTQEPDFAGKARAMAEAHFCQAAFEADPSIEQTYGWDQMLISADADRIECYASCMEAKLRSDWETIGLLRMVDDSCHPGDCEGEQWTNDRPGRNGKMPVRNPCTCGLRAHLSTLEAQFQ